MRAILILLIVSALFVGWSASAVAGLSIDSGIVYADDSGDKKEKKKNGEEEPDCE